MTLSPFAPLQALLRHQSEKGAASVPGEKELLDCCAVPVETALLRAGVTDKGLPEEGVLERRAKFGLNEIAKRKKLGFIGEILQRCRNPLVIQLFVIVL